MFGADVYNLLRTQGHDIVGVFTIPDANGKADPLAVAAEADNVPVFKFPRWRKKVDGKFQVRFLFPKFTCVENFNDKPPLKIHNIYY